MYVQCSTQARTCKHCCNGKVISITYHVCVCVCVCVALVIQHEMRMRHIVNCDLPGSTVLFHIML